MLAKVRSVISPRGQPPPKPSSEESSSQIPPPKIGMVVDMADTHLIGGIIPVITGSDKLPHPYCRPEFLYLTEDEISLSADQTIRPVMTPKYPTQMPVYAGYAEVINTGKSKENEDMAAAKVLNFVQQGYEAEKAIELEDKSKDSNKKKQDKLQRKPSDDDLLVISQSFSSDDGPIAPKAEAAFFGLFDGHAGSGAAIMTANCLHEHIKSRLNEVLESVMHLNRQEQLLRASRKSSFYSMENENWEEPKHQASINSDSLVIGALEAAFVDMDEQIAEEKTYIKVTGGCASIVSLIFLGKVYVANAGDCRAILITPNKVLQLSNDFNPVHERKRLQAAKTVREPDLKPPLISTRTRKPRLLNTIGVCRGFGDHHLMTADDKIAIKTFLSPFPEVQVFDVRTLDTLTDREVIIMASDGLWDVLNNDDVAQIVRSALSQNDVDDFSKYTLIAQELVAAARGEQVGQFKWKLSNGAMASTDDITVFVIPLKFAVNLPKGDEDDDEELLS
uniref:PPM-type phosphatase domain-containing protein n=1 Tax=Panagrolaimus sp. ES5 TaxID=591445 RepID=A0AC34GWE0_9BILA